MEYKLTQYSHGAGCGCKIAPNVLHEILASNIQQPDANKLIVGNNTKDDAAVYDIGNGQALISTTDFFMPIVDDAFDFGRIASANAISDVYAMGGYPIMAIAILGWPINTLPTHLATKLIEGSRAICNEARIPLAGGHSIDAPEPIFGLAVSGLVDINHIKQNNTAQHGDVLFLTKPLGIGILSTAAKKNLLKDQHGLLATQQMVKLNIIGHHLSSIDGVHAMTDVTGFGLLGHLWEMCEGSGLSAAINFQSIPFICDSLIDYIEKGAVPGGTLRNLAAYGYHVNFDSTLEKPIVEKLLADPQTSGGLLISVQEKAVHQVISLFENHGLQNFIQPIGKLSKNKEVGINVLQ